MYQTSYLQTTPEEFKSNRGGKKHINPSPTNDQNPSNRFYHDHSHSNIKLASYNSYISTRTDRSSSPIRNNANKEFSCLQDMINNRDSYTYHQDFRLKHARQISPISTEWTFFKENKQKSPNKSLISTVFKQDELSPVRNSSYKSIRSQKSADSSRVLNPNKQDTPKFKPILKQYPSYLKQNNESFQYQSQRMHFSNVSKNKESKNDQINVKNYQKPYYDAFTQQQILDVQKGVKKYDPLMYTSELVKKLIQQQEIDGNLYRFIEQSKNHPLQRYSTKQ